MSNNQTEVKAGFFVRLAAYCIDMIIVAAALLVFRVPFWIIAIFDSDNILLRDFIFDYSIKDIFFYILQASYFVILTYKTGSTVGKKLLCLQVVSDSEEPLKLFDVIYRETVGRFLSSILWCAGYFMIGLQNDKKGLHDILSDTKVVYQVRSCVNSAVNNAKTIDGASAHVDGEQFEQMQLAEFAADK